MPHRSPPLWVPACAGMTVGVGLPQMGYDGRAQLFRFGRDNVVLRDLSVNVLSVNEGIEETSADSDLVRRWPIRADQELRPSRFWEILGTGVVSCSYGTPWVMGEAAYSRTC